MIMQEENDISKIILDCAYKVHTKLGSGLLEKYIASVWFLN